MAASTSLHLTPSSRFDLRLTAESHGWCGLPPFVWNPEEGRLETTVALSSGVYDLGIAQVREDRIRVKIKPGVAVEERSVLRAVVSRMLGARENLEEFHGLCRRDPELRWAARRGAGRLLRCPTVWEDLLKVLCTTNCSWSLTRQMVGRLVEKAGPVGAGGRHAFPRPQDLRGRGESWYREVIRAGYRSAYFVELVERVLSGELDPESWAAPDADPHRVEAELRSIKGAGPYAKELVQRLLGRFDGHALDSWCRAAYYQKYHRGRRVKDSTIRKRYRDYGEWAGLALWLDLTSSWHEHSKWE